MKPFICPSIKYINKLKKKYTAVSMFAGCGGASTGYKLAGFDVLYANEFIPIAKETYEANASESTYVDGADIRIVTPKQILKYIGLKKGELDLYDASPPCSAFSTAGVTDDKWSKVALYSEGVKQRVDDLFDESIRVMKGLMPKVFVNENVVGLTTGPSKGYLLEILGKLRACGYTVEARLVDPSKFGAPQKRVRLIIMGVRNDLVKKYKVKPSYPDIRAGQVSVRDVLPHVHYIRVTTSTKVEFKTSDMPSPTITATDATNSPTSRFSCGGFLEDDKGIRRKYTIPELKKIFTFPHDFKLTGNFQQRWERIGRSHIPVSTYMIGKAIGTNILDIVNAN